MGGEIRVRFAPSPTGYLHVGGARTALYNWLYARKEGGAFVLRIEDTDVEKSSSEMAEAIIAGLTWLGIDWDEGPHYQSRDREKHQKAVDRLLERGAAYRCFCPKEVVDEAKKAAMDIGAPAVYPGACRDLPEELVANRLDAGDPYTVRFRTPPGDTTFTDEVYGNITSENRLIGDFVLLRSDGSPTYNLAVVIDDSDMAITHVIRGEDHLSNTPKQILIYRALDLPTPTFAHLPLILGSDKQRLSKRHGAVSVGIYHEEGILPEALFNFLALLGWSPGDDREIMTREEIISAFSLDRVIKKGAVFDPEKLEWMNSQYFSSSTTERLIELVTPLLKEAGLFDPIFLDERREWYGRVLTLLKDRAHRLHDFIDHGAPFFMDDFEYDPAAVAKRWKSSSTVDYLIASRDALNRLDPFSTETIEEAVRGLAEELGVSASKLIHPIRVAVTGRAVGPGLFELLEVLGKETASTRIDRAVEYLKQHPDLMGGQPE